MKWIIWILAVFFYFYEYVLRVAPSVMVHQIMEAFTISASSLGVLSAFYFYAYAPMQIPAGFLMDHFGARKLLTLATFICAIGAGLFGLSTNFWFACLARLFMGFGSAFAFVGMVFLCSHLFEARRLALLIGFGNSLGMLGGVSEAPLGYIVFYIGWRATYVGLGVLGLILTAALYISIRSTPSSKKPPAAGGEIWPRLSCNLKLISRNPYTWLNAVIALCFLATTISYAGLWAIPFIKQTREVSARIAALSVSIFFVGWIIGGPIIGHFSDKWKKRKPILLIFSFLAFLATSVLIFFPSYVSFEMTFVLHFLMGLFSSAMLLCFSLSIEINPEIAKGAAAAMTNFVVFLGGACLQPLVGFLIEYKANFPGPDNQTFTLPEFQFGLAIFPILFGVAFILSLFLKEQPFNPKNFKMLEKMVCKS